MVRLHNGRIATLLRTYQLNTGKMWVEYEYKNGTISNMPLYRWNSLVEVRV